MTKYLLLIILIFFISVSADDIDIGLSLLSQGKFSEACEYINRAYKNSPSSPRVQLAYARTVTNGIEAQKLYKKIVANESAGESLKSKAYCMLGFLYYCKEDYDSARSMFNKAEKSSASEIHTHMRALAAFNRGDNRTPEAAWAPIASDDKKKDRHKALYYLGNMFYRQGKYEQAYNCYKNASEMKNMAWTVPALTGACLSSYYNGDTLFSTILYNQINKEYPFLLETELLKQTAPGHGRFTETDIKSRDDFGSVDSKTSERKQDAATNAEKAVYTLQVGAFGSEDNAKKLYRKMQKDFEDVTIKKEKIKGKVFHKVRVELFTKKEDALAYGERHLKSRGISFRAVKK